LLQLIGNTTLATPSAQKRTSSQNADLLFSELYRAGWLADYSRRL
jgi:hypothetical protein